MASTDVGSSRNTSRFIGPFLRWIYPEVSDEAISMVQAFVRKSAHLTVYAVLAALTWRARRMTRGNWNEWLWPEFWAISAFCCLYAISDELHQAFVSSRQGHPLDVFFDTTGAVAALLAIRWVTLRQARPGREGGVLPQSITPEPRQ